MVEQNLASETNHLDTQPNVMDSLLEEFKDIPISLDDIDDVPTVSEKVEESKSAIKGDKVILSTSKLDVLRTALEVAEKIAMEGEIVFEDEFVSINVPDQTTTYMLVSKMFNLVFDKVEKPHIPIYINFKDLLDMIKAQTNKNLKLVLQEDNQLIAYVTGKTIKKANIPLLAELDKKMPNIPDMEFEIDKIQVDTSTMQEIIDEAKKLAGKDSPFVFLMVEKGKFTIKTSNDLRWIDFDIKAGFDETKSMKTKYNASFLEPFLNKRVEKVEISFGFEFPVRLKLVKPNEFVLYGYIAPIVEHMKD